MTTIASVRAAVARAEQRVAAGLPGDADRARRVLKQQSTKLERLEQRCVCGAPRYRGHDGCVFCAAREGALA